MMAAPGLLQLAAPLTVALAVAAVPALGQNELAWSPGSSSISEREEFPLAFRGKWAPTIEACSDEDGVPAIFVYPGGLETYESGGRLQRITRSGEERTVLARLAFEGEGRFWDSTWTMALSQDGRAMTISETEIVEDASLFVKCGDEQKPGR